MKILILDPYPDRPWRISKDTIGGFGTANRFGDGLVSRAITWLFNREVDWPPLYAVHAAGVLRDQGHDVLYSRVWRDEGWDLALMTSSTVCHETELDAARAVAASGTPIGVMGPFATTLPGPYLDAGAFVIAGEPEMTFLKNPIDAETIKGFQGVVPAVEPVPLDELPRPAWEMVFAVNPPKFGLLGPKQVVLPLAATRGCPYSCFQYCVYPLQQGRKVRTVSPERVVADMSHWQDTLGVSYFIFRDPLFAIDKAHTMALCDAIEASGRTFRFTVETHLQNMVPDLAKKLAAAGMDMVKVGVESVDPEVLKSARRFTMKQEEERKRIAELEALGVKITTHYILAMPADTEETCRATVRYACGLNTLFAQISVFTPYPGTPAYADFDGRIEARTSEDFTQYDLVFRHDNLSAARVRKLLSEAYRTYYTRPSWVWKFARVALSDAALRLRGATKH